MPRYVPEQANQKSAERSLKNIQAQLHPDEPESGDTDASREKKKQKLRTYMQGGADVVFFLLIAFAVLKDIYDITSAGLLTEETMGEGSLLAAIGKELAITGAIAASGAAVAGIGAIPTAIIAAIRLAIRAGIGIYQVIGAIKAGVNFAAATIAPFMFNLMFQWLAVVALFMLGGFIKRFLNRWKLIIGLFILEFIAESFLGLNWFPGATFYAILLYRIVLKDRRKSATSQTQETPESEPEYAYADN